jgi:hypothetical protein
MKVALNTIKTSFLPLVFFNYSEIDLLLMSFLIAYAMCNYIKLIIDAMRSLL